MGASQEVVMDREQCVKDAIAEPGRFREWVSAREDGWTADAGNIWMCPIAQFVQETCEVRAMVSTANISVGTTFGDGMPVPRRGRRLRYLQLLLRGRHNPSVARSLFEMGSRSIQLTGEGAHRMSAGNPTERPEERDSLAPVERRLKEWARQDAFPTQAVLDLRTLMNEVKELREELFVAKEVRHFFFKRSEQMEEALREAETRTDIAPKDWDRWGHVVRHRIAEAHDIIRAALSPSDTEDQ
jgi:hypothetical protein